MDPTNSLLNEAVLTGLNGLGGKTMVKKISNWKDLLIQQGTSIVQAIKVIDSGGMQLALVIDEEGRLIGTVSDGDIRRGILRGIPLDHSVGEVMNCNPLVAGPSTTQDEIFSLLKSHILRQLPILDTSRRILGLAALEDFLNKETHDNPVIIMAGGMGHRLYPLTRDTPKPMLRVGSKPILESIVENFISQGFRSFYFSVNYKAEMVKNYFQDGSQFGAKIQYVEEETRLGTAGALSLLPVKPKNPVIVMNGDLLTKVNFNQLLEFHIQQGAIATMCVKEYEFQVPYGVVSLDQRNHHIHSIDEKPTHKFFVNGGIYVLNPVVLDRIPKGQTFDMTSLFAELIDTKSPIGAFPVREYWMDIGRLDDFEKANATHQEMTQ